MRRAKRAVVACAAAVLAILAMSCASAPTVPYNYNKPVEKTSYADPSNSVLVYGSARGVDAGLATFLTGSVSVVGLQLVQLNPKIAPMVITPARDGVYFFTQPLPVGSSLKFFLFSSSTSQSVVTYYRGVQGQGPADLRLTKPGLLYLGSLVLCDQAYAKTHKLNLFAADTGSMDLYPVGPDKEADALKALLPKYRATSWEPVILARIKELTK